MLEEEELFECGVGALSAPQRSDCVQARPKSWGPAHLQRSHGVLSGRKGGQPALMVTKLGSNALSSTSSCPLDRRCLAPKRLQ